MYDKQKSSQNFTYQLPEVETAAESQNPVATSEHEVCEPEANERTGALQSMAITVSIPTWHPEKNEDGNYALVGAAGDSFDTLKAYLKEIYGSEDKIPQEEWNNFEQQINFLQENGITDLKGQRICSDKGTFENLPGIFLVTKSETKPEWGYYNPSGIPGANACSPSLANRSAEAVKFVYGEESEPYKKLDRDNKMPGFIGYNQFQNNYGPKAKIWNEKEQKYYTGTELYKKRNAAKYGLTEEMRGHSVGGAVEYSGAGEYVPEDKIWSGGLKPGAAIGLGFHTGIFIKYEYENEKIVDIWYWDHHNEVKRVKEHDGYDVRIGGNWF